MKNAKDELLDHIKYREVGVKYVRITYGRERAYDETGKGVIEGTLDAILPKLDFKYDDGFGSQYIFGTIWYTDGTWSDRDEHDGSEWWAYRKCPSLPSAAL